MEYISVTQDYNMFIRLYILHRNSGLGLVIVISKNLIFFW